MQLQLWVTQRSAMDIFSTSLSCSLWQNYRYA